MQCRNTLRIPGYIMWFKDELTAEEHNVKYELEFISE